MSAISLDQVSNRIRYESISKLASDIGSASSFEEVDTVLHRHCKYIVSAYKFIFGFFIEDQVIDFALNEDSFFKKNYLSRAMEEASGRPKIYNDSNGDDDFSKAMFCDEKVASVIKVSHVEEGNNYIVYFASKSDQYSHVDAKFIKLIAEIVFPKVQSILLNEKIRLQNQDLQAAYKEIEIVNNELTGSINYAQKIQQALIPSRKTLNEGISKNFVLLYPREGVSGDFYYSYESHDRYVIVAADCTGHGVPGAMLSIFCIQLFREVCRSIEDLSPDKILTEIDQRFKHYLLDGIAEEEEVRMSDGMDVSIVTICKKEKSLWFAGAGRPLVYLQNGEIKTIKGSLFPIGSHRSFKQKEFKLHQIDYSAGDRFFLFSDGYPDQFGGPRGKKLRSSRFKSLLENTANLPIEQQGEAMDKELKEWQGNQPQVDDILLIGIEP